MERARAVQALRTAIASDPPATLKHRAVLEGRSVSKYRHCMKSRLTQLLPTVYAALAVIAVAVLAYGLGRMSVDRPAVRYGQVSVNEPYAADQACRYWRSLDAREVYDDHAYSDYKFVNDVVQLLATAAGTDLHEDSFALANAITSPIPLGDELVLDLIEILDADCMAVDRYVHPPAVSVI